MITNTTAHGKEGGCLLDFSEAKAFDYQLRAVNGHPAPRANQIYAKVGRSFAIFHRNFDNYTVVQYLRGIANLVPHPLRM